MSDRNDLAGRVAIVTGAAQGVGEATARALAARGASLVLADRKADQVNAVAKDLADLVPAVAVVADLSDPEGPPQVVEGALAEMGQIDLLASIAGLGLRGTILDTSVELWDEMIALNLRAHFQLIQGVARNLVERDVPGAIAVAGSMNALGGQQDLCAYSSAKGGLATLVRHCAHALLPHRIRVNIVNFGWMHTEGEIAIQAAAHGQDEAGLLRSASELPFGRLITPAEAAHLVEYLLTDDSSVMTGSTINFDQSVPGSGPTTAVRLDWLTRSP
jgi:NAD(P)-dependent dehydrogenase (short-subunit alcohol dehydrogenase family)